MALTVVMAHRPARPLPFAIDELRGASRRPPAPLPGPGPRGPADARPADSWPWTGLSTATNGCPAGSSPATSAASRAGRAERWIVQRQEADGLWGGIQPPVVYSIIALHLQGYPLDHPVMRAALAGLDGFLIHDERGRRVEACQSPVWDTALAVVALADAGAAADDPAMSSAARWLLGEEITVRGDWAVRRPRLAPGGWAFEFANDNYPDIDDTAEVVLALRAGPRRPGSPRRPAAPAPAVTPPAPGGWPGRSACRAADGGWGAFDADNDSRLVAALPFCDFGEVTDPPSADVTAHVIEMLAESSPACPPVALQRGASTGCRRQQEADGSWFGRWGVNYVYGTGAAVPALVAAGVPADDPRIRRAVAWLEEHQTARRRVGRGPALLRRRRLAGPGPFDRRPRRPGPCWPCWPPASATGRRPGRGVGWLVANQRADGTWDEPWFTGTGFPWDFSINYHLYRLVWPVMALGRYVRAVRRGRTVTNRPRGPAPSGSRRRPAA